MRESVIERDVTAEARALGWLVWKFTSPGLRGVPDRFFAKSGKVVFMEIKAPGEAPTPQQRKRHAELETAGIETHWVTSVFQAKTILGKVRFD